MANCVGGGTGETEPPFGGLEAVTGATAGKKRIEMSIFWSLDSFILITLFVSLTHEIKPLDVIVSIMCCFLFFMNLLLVSKIMDNYVTQMASC